MSITAERDSSMLQTLGAALEGTALGQYVAASAWAFPTLEAVHVLFLATVFGSIVVVDLRLIGLAFRTWRVTELSAEVLPITWVAFAGAVVSGGLLLSSQATTYLANTSFRLKVLMLALAGLNMLIFQLVTRRTLKAWDDRGVPPSAARAGGLLSICFWIGVVVFGRWIGFTLY
jgi:hypothetical protein